MSNRYCASGTSVKINEIRKNCRSCALARTDKPYHPACRWEVWVLCEDAGQQVRQSEASRAHAVPSLIESRSPSSIAGQVPVNKKQLENLAANCRIRGDGAKCAVWKNRWVSKGNGGGIQRPQTPLRLTTCERSSNSRRDEHQAKVGRHKCDWLFSDRASLRMVAPAPTRLDRRRSSVPASGATTE